MDEVKKEVITPAVDEEKIEFQWDAPERAFKRRDRDFWITAIGLLFLLSVILFLIKEFLLILTLGSLLFLAYILSTVPPENAHHKISNRGVYFGEQFYPWTVLEKFWFKPSLDSPMVHYLTLLRFPKVISFVIDPQDQEKITQISGKYVQLITSSPTFIDKAVVWARERLPLEDRKKN